MTRGAWLLVGALVVVLGVAHLLRDTPGYAVRDASGEWHGDIDHYVYWTKLVTEGGVQAAYGGTWPETFAVYPPVTLYGYQLIGTVYRAFVDPSFEVQRALHDPWLLRGIKFQAVGWHILTVLGIFFVLAPRFGSDRAGVAAAIYAVNPAMLFDVAHWGQPDGAHSFFSVVAIGSLEARRYTRGWLGMAMAMLAKPQAWAIAPLMGLMTWREGGFRELVKSGLVAVGVAIVVLLPFLVTGRLGEFLSLPGQISSVMPSVTANAHNFWWLDFVRRGVDPIFVNDSSPFAGAISFRTAALIVVGANLLLGYWLYWTGRAAAAEVAALSVLGWFVFTTQAHENHLFFALPLLAIAWSERRALLVPFGVLTVTVFLNMALHDQPVVEMLGFDLNDPLVQGLRTANAVTNVLTFLIWTGWAMRRPSAGKEKASPKRGLERGTGFEPATLTLAR